MSASLKEGFLFICFYFLINIKVIFIAICNIYLMHFFPTNTKKKYFWAFLKNLKSYNHKKIYNFLPDISFYFGNKRSKILFNLFCLIWIKVVLSEALRYRILPKNVDIVKQYFMNSLRFMNSLSLRLEIIRALAIILAISLWFDCNFLSLHVNYKQYNKNTVTFYSVYFLNE